MKRSHLAREIVEILALTLLIFIVVRFVIQSYHVEGASMETQLQNNEYVMVNKVAYLFGKPERGDVIVFHNPYNTQEDYIKRVIGLPGDTVKYDSTRIWVNGKQLNETAYVAKSINQKANEVVVPADQYFVLGDNRAVSADSRADWFVPKNFIVGKAAVVFWPLNKFHFINTYPDVYKDIPPAKKA